MHRELHQTPHFGESLQGKEGSDHSATDQPHSPLKHPGLAASSRVTAVPSSEERGHYVPNPPPPLTDRWRDPFRPS